MATGAAVRPCVRAVGVLYAYVVRCHHMARLWECVPRVPRSVDFTTRSRTLLLRDETPCTGIYRGYSCTAYTQILFLVGRGPTSFKNEFNQKRLSHQY